MATANDQAWAHYLAERNLLLDGRMHRVSADDLKAVTGREPRLLAKYDEPGQLARCLVEAGYSIWPVRNGEYLLCRCDTFCRLPAGPPVEPVRSDLPFPLETAARGQGESQYIDHAHNTGLLQRFVGVPELFLTIRGREYSQAFGVTMRDEGVSFAVDRVQIEVDAGYEGQRDIVLVEAKVGARRAVNIRQVYYPWRHFQAITPHKTVRPVVLNYDVGTTCYELHELTFATTDDPTTWQVLRSACIRLHEPDRSRLEELLDPTWQRRCDLVPQADDLNKIVRLLESLQGGLTSSEAIADEFGFEPRQARYYREAAEYLGLVEAGGCQLCPAAREILRSGPRQRRRLLAKAVANSWILLDRWRAGEPVTAAAIERAIAAVPGPRHRPRYSGATLQRRTRTQLAWLRWLAAEVGCVREVGDTFVPA